MSWPSYPGRLASLQSASGPSRVPPPFPAKDRGLQDSSKGLICSRALARRSGKGKTGYLFSWLTDCLSWAGWLIPFAQSYRQLPPDSLPHTFILLRLQEFLCPPRPLRPGARKSGVLCNWQLHTQGQFYCWVVPRGLLGNPLALMFTIYPLVS